MANPNIPQGNLNRAVASFTCLNFPQLNVYASYLGRNAIRFSREGGATMFLPQLVGVVTSNELYLMVTISLQLIKTQPVAAAYEAQIQTQSVIGNCTVRPDVTTGLQPFDILECAIETPGELSFSGEDAAYPITIKGYQQINNSLFG